MTQTPDDKRAALVTLLPLLHVHKGIMVGPGDAPTSRAVGNTWLGGIAMADDTATHLGPNPSGLCQCGCGRPTPLATRNREGGIVKGQPVRYLKGHAPFRDVADAGDALCECGCGLHAPLGKAYRRGHNLRRRGPEYHVDEMSGCWIWQGWLNPAGYGRTSTSWKGRLVMAHRLVYERERGPIPEGYELDHLCRNKACVNPNHLEPVQRHENIRRRPDVKLSPEAISNIRASLDAGVKGKDLAVKYGVTPTTISAIKQGKTWADE